MGYIFDGTAKTVTLTSGTTTLDLIDLHSRWKDWVYSNNAGYLIAFRTVGGDIPAIPLYLFLLNGWKVIPQSANHTLTVINGIFEVDGGGDPFIDPAGSYKIRINRETPGIAIGYSSSGSTINEATLATAVWSKSLEGLSADEMMRIMLAALAGKRVGLGTTTEYYMAQDDTTPRITFTPDEFGNGDVTINGAI